MRYNKKTNKYYSILFLFREWRRGGGDHEQHSFLFHAIPCICFPACRFLKISHENESDDCPAQIWPKKVQINWFVKGTPISFRGRVQKLHESTNHLSPVTSFLMMSWQWSTDHGKDIWKKIHITEIRLNKKKMQKACKY